MFAKLKAWFLKTNKDGETSLHIAKIVTVATFAILLAWGGFTTWVLRNYEHLQDSASYGDSFGAVNSLFSALALAGVVLAILMQREELILQRRELEETREVLKEAADAQTESMKALRAQADSAFLGGYLNALVAAGQTELTHRSSPEQRKAYERVIEISQMLEEQATTILGRKLSIKTNGAIVARQLFEVRIQFSSQWDAFEQEYMANASEVISVVDKVRSQIEILSPHFSEFSEHQLSNLYSALNSINRLVSTPAANDERPARNKVIANKGLDVVTTLIDLANHAEYLKD